MKTKEQKETFNIWIETRYSFHDKVWNDVHFVFMSELNNNVYPINEFTDNTIFEILNIRVDHE